MSLSIGLVCDVGIGPQKGGRRRNEDNFLVCHEGRAHYRGEDGARVQLDRQGEGTLVVVCDGMGGHADGDIAAAKAVHAMSDLYQPGASRHPARQMLQYIIDSHARLHEAACSDGPVSMGTTLSAAWLMHGTVAWAHVGDSRIYLWRRGGLKQLTTDQTRNEFARRDGLPVSDEGEHLVQNFIYGSRGLGDNTLLRLEHGLDAGAELLHPGDRLLLCTDGISGVIQDNELSDLISSSEDPQQVANVMCDQAKHRGSRDNMTALVLRVDAVGDNAL